MAGSRCTLGNERFLKTLMHPIELLVERRDA